MSDALDYRSWGGTRNCKGCRYWSEMVAQSIGGGPVQAMCLNQASPNRAKFTGPTRVCDQWAEGSLGAVDDPGGNPYADESNSIPY